MTDTIEDKETLFLPKPREPILALRNKSSEKTAVKEKQLSELSLFRLALGLTEQRESPDLEAIAKDRRQKADIYLETKAKPSKEGFFKDIKEQQGELQEYLATRPQRQKLKEQAERAKVKIQLKAKGVKNAEAIISAMEKIDAYSLFRYGCKDDEGKEYRFKYRTISVEYSGLLRLVPQLKGIDNPGLAFQRLVEMGCRLSVYQVNNKPIFTKALQKLSHIPQEKFDAFLEQLRPYNCLRHSGQIIDSNDKGYIDKLTPEFSIFLEAAEQGGFTAEQLELLKVAQRVSDLTNGRYKIEIDKLFQNPQLIKDVCIVVEQIYNEKLDDSSFNTDYYSFYLVDNLHLLADQGKLHLLAEVISQGMEIGNLNLRTIGYNLSSQLYQEDKQALIENIALATEVLHAADGGFMLAMQEYLEFNNMDRLEEVQKVTDFCRALQEEIKKLDDEQRLKIVVELGIKGADILDGELKELLPALESADEFDYLLLDDDKLNKLLRGFLLTKNNKWDIQVIKILAKDGFFMEPGFISEIIDQFPEEEKSFWLFWDKIPETLKSFVLENRDNFEDLVVNGQPQPAFFETVLKQTHNEVIHRELTAMLTDEVLASFPEEKKAFWEKLRLINNKSSYAKYITEFYNYFKGKTFEQCFLDILQKENFDRAGWLFGRIIQFLYVNKTRQRNLVPIGLCAWRVWNDQYYNPRANPKELTDIVRTARKEIDRKLHSLQALEIDLPEGLRVSIGIEIEVLLNGIARSGKITKEDIINIQYLKQQQRKRPSSFIDEYLEEMEFLIKRVKDEYTQQVELIDKMGVGKGSDAVHEFSPLPVSDYSTLLWELYEISRLGFIDFDRKLLQWIEKGMHLTIAGDQNSIGLDENARLLQIAMLSSGWCENALLGAGAAQAVEELSGNSDKLFKQIKGFIYSPVRKSIFEDDMPNINSVEARALQINSFELLARTIKSFYYLAVPLKAYQKYRSKFNENMLLEKVRQEIDSGARLRETIFQTRNILFDIQDEAIKNMIITWAYFREATIKAFAEKQKPISRYKLRNPTETYTNRDMTRLNAELLEVFGGIKPETGELEEDALETVHKKPKPGSLPEEMRRIIIECRSNVKKTFS